MVVVAAARLDRDKVLITPPPSVLVDDACRCCRTVLTDAARIIRIDMPRANLDGGGGCTAVVEDTADGDGT